MSDESTEPEVADGESAAPAETPAAEPAAPAAMNTAAAAEDSEPAAQEPAAQEPKRTPRARKPKAEAEPAPAATSEKPRRTRAAKPVAEEPAPAAKSKAAPKRGAAKRREAPVAGAVVRAQAKYVRSSARKARLVCDNIRGKSVTDARAILAHTPRAVARDWSKLLESAVANAENNHELDGEDLVIKAVHADEGPTLKRFRPRAQGRATKIRKRTAHLTILLTPKN